MAHWFLLLSSVCLRHGGTNFFTPGLGFHSRNYYLWQSRHNTLCLLVSSSWMHLLFSFELELGDRWFSSTSVQDFHEREDITGGHLLDLCSLLSKPSWKWRIRKKRPVDGSDRMNLTTSPKALQLWESYRLLVLLSSSPNLTAFINQLLTV